MKHKALTEDKRMFVSDSDWVQKDLGIISPI